MRYEQRSELCTRGLVKKKKEYVERVRVRAALRRGSHLTTSTHVIFR